ncbi:MAG: serine hydrolase domain-containing protein, partial [Flavobacteriaceae bacterium]|nr:serine hydrolase domain-containing protein [Flavobacteriaceae bacterium]
MKNYGALLLIGIVLVSCTKKPTTASQPASELNTLQDSLTAELNEIHKKGQINGFSVAIVNADTVLYEQGVGFSDSQKKLKYTEKTIQNIASISKTLIGISLLKAQEMGKLNLDDPVNNYLPFQVRNPNFPSEPITIRHLATHTSSIIDTDIYDHESYILEEKIDSAAMKFVELPKNFKVPDKKTSMTDFLQKVLSEDGKWYTKNGFLKKKPGEFYEYTNIGATLAAVILEQTTGVSYNKFTAKHILGPLSMDGSGWFFDEIDTASHSKLYNNPTTRIPLYSLITYPDGGLRTSSHDLGKYLIELIQGYSGHGKLLTKESYQELFRPQLDSSNFSERNAENPYNDEFDSGIFMGFSAKGYIGHSGGDPGVSSFMFFD